MAERKFWGDCRDDENFGKPFTFEEIERVRALQVARLRFATEARPVHSSTGADGRWLATIDELRELLKEALYHIPVTAIRPGTDDLVFLRRAILKVVESKATQGETR